MIWSRGFTAKYYYTVVDPYTWRDLGSYQMTGGSIMKTNDSLMESADIDITCLPSEGEAWVRIYLAATQGGSGARVALFTGLLQAPATDWDGRRESHKAELYSVLKPADDVLLPRGWFARAGSSGATLAAELLEIGPAPVTCADGSPALTDHLIAEAHETNLSMAQKLVDAVGWRIRISGDGNISIEPKAAVVSAELDPLGNDIVELSITDKRDWYSCPNVFRAAVNNLVAVAIDDDPDSLYSTVSRGREIWKEDDAVALNDGESLEEYAIRRLREEQSPTRSISYGRRYLPEVYPGDLVSLTYPAQRISGTFKVVSQRIELGYGARVAEECETYG